MKVRKAFSILFISLLFFSGCSFDYEQAELAGSFSKGIPNTLVRNYTYVDIRAGQSSFQIYASRAEMYHKDHQTTLEDIFFQEFNEEGEIVTEGEADYAVLDTQTDNIEIRGSIHFASSLYDMIIQADYLYWNNESRTLEGKPEQEVFLEKQDGTVIQGRGFSVDSSSRNIYFDSEVEGTYVYSDEEEQTQ